MTTRTPNAVSPQGRKIGRTYRTRLVKQLEPSGVRVLWHQDPYDTWRAAHMAELERIVAWAETHEG